MNGERVRNLLTGVLFCIFGLATALFLIPNGISVPGGVQIRALSPDFWPTIIAWATVGASVALIIESSLLRQPGLDGQEEDERDSSYDLPKVTALLRTAVLILALFGFYFALPVLGIVVPSIILLAAMMLFFGERNAFWIAGLSIGLPVLLYGFFRYIANVPIPLGIFAG